MIAGEKAASSAVGEFAVPEARCRPDDRVETGLQGQVPVADRLTGRAAEGYNCNLELIGSHASTAWASLDTYQDCAYYGDLSDDGGTVVVDVSNPAKPKQTDYLTTAAMAEPWESLRVNHKRGLLVADHDAEPELDVYDVSKDCRHPKLLFSGRLGTARGHEGWFQPDGRVYYMSKLNYVYPIDLSNPKKPRQMVEWEFDGSIHGGSISDDGTRGYFCQSTGGGVGLLTVDTSEVQAGKPSPNMKVISSLPLPDNFACQATYPVTYDGHPYVIQYGELSVERCPGWSASRAIALSAGSSPAAPGTPVFDYPRIIDVANEKKPKVVSRLLLEVDDPLNCPFLTGDMSPTSGNVILGVLFGYDVHHCSPDRLHDPTILACEQFMAGLRVYDIRNPRKPKELAYYNPGTLSATDPTVDMAISRPVVRPDLRQVWFTTQFRGFLVVEFAPGVWPFKDSPKCPPRKDYFFAHYNPSTKC